MIRNYSTFGRNGGKRGNGKMGGDKPTMLASHRQMNSVCSSDSFHDPSTGTLCKRPMFFASNDAVWLKATSGGMMPPNHFYGVPWA